MVLKDPALQNSTPDDRGAVSQAMSWVNRITAGSLLLLLPVAAGYWLDQHFQTGVLLLVAGFILGMLFSSWHLWRMLQDLERDNAG